MLKNIFPLLLILIFISCSKSQKKEQIKIETPTTVTEIRDVNRDLSSILKDGKLRVSTTYSGTSYFYTKENLWVLSLNC